MTRELTRRHRIRLAPEAYGVIGSVCSVTIGVKARVRVFAEPRVAAAAVHNPVRTGIVSHWQQYPFCGSLTLDLFDDDGSAGDKPPPYQR